MIANRVTPMTLTFSEPETTARCAWFAFYVTLAMLDLTGSAFDHPTSTSPQSPIRIASAASCRNEVGRAAPDHSITLRAIAPAEFLA